MRLVLEGGRGHMVQDGASCSSHKDVANQENIHTNDLSFIG